MTQLFLHTTDAGEKQEVLFISPGILRRNEFASDARDFLEASGDFGIVKYEQFRSSGDIFRLFRITTSKKIELKFSPDGEIISFFYPLNGFFQYSGGETVTELLVQQQVKQVHEETGKPYFLNVYPTSGKEFIILHVTASLLTHVEGKRGISEIRDYIRKTSFIRKMPKLFTAGLGFQKTMNDLQLEVGNHKPSIPFFHTYIDILLLELLMQAENQREIENESEAWDPEKHAVYQMAESIIIGMDESMTIKYFARSQHMNPNRLKILFKEHMGMPAAAFRISVRMQKARQLLTETSISIQEISALVGYSNPAQFSTMFKKKMGFSPHEIRRNVLPGMKM